MDTNINSIQDRFSHDTIRYDDGELRNIISQLKTLLLRLTPWHKRIRSGRVRLRSSIWDLRISLNSINQIFQKQLESFMRLLMG